MTIYIDIIFLENLFMNFIILYATAIILKIDFKIIRTLVSSIIGGAYAVLMYISSLEIYSNIILKIVLSLVMVEVAYNPKTFKEFIKNLSIFYLTSFTFGGVAIALIYFINPANIFFSNGKLTGVYPIKTILLGGILGFIITITTLKNLKKKISKEDMFCNIEIKYENKFKYITAIIDTGNFLKDPISKAPVIVVDKMALEGVFSQEILDNLDKIISEKNIELEAYLQKIRLIPFASLGKQNGLLIGVKPDTVIINYQESTIQIKNVIIGIYDGVLSKTGKYQGLIGLDALNP